MSDRENATRVRDYVVLEELDLAELVERHRQVGRVQDHELAGHSVLVPVEERLAARNTEAAMRAAGKVLARAGRFGKARLVAIVDRYWAEDTVTIGDPPVTVGGDDA